MGDRILKGGFQSSGPWSPLDSFTLSVTAKSCGLTRSLAKACRWAVVHAEAPDYRRGMCQFSDFTIYVSRPRSHGCKGKSFTNLPGIRQGDQVVNIDVARLSPRGPIIGGDPGASGDAATTGALDHVGSVTLEHYITRIATSISTISLWCTSSVSTDISHPDCLIQ